MKLCITAVGNSMESQVDNSFGRALWLIIVDTRQNVMVNAIENSGVNASQGAGIAAAQAIADHGADGLLTGRVGPKARAALEAAGVKIYENIAHGTVREGLDRFNAGQYRELTGAVEYGVGSGPGKGGGRGSGRGGRGQGGGGRRGGM